MIRHSYALAAAAAVPVAVAGMLALTACGTGSAGRAGSAGRDTAVKASTGAPVSEADRDWLAGMHRSGLADVRYGRLAERKGATAAVREAGSTLAADHAAFDEKVVQAAARLHVDLPGSAGSARLAVARRLENESGSRFDRDFTATTIEEHRKAITDAETEAREGSSPEVTGLAREVLPDLRRHLAMLRKASPVG